MPAPDYAPQLATLVKEAPAGGEWLHEIKFDGYRIGARLRGGRVTLERLGGAPASRRARAAPLAVRSTDARRARPHRALGHAVPRV